MSVRVLIAHRDPQALEAPRTWAKELGYAVRTASTLAEGAEQLGQDPCEVLLLDLRLLATDRPERALQELDPTGRCAWIAWIESPGEGPTALAHGAAALLHPPVDRANLRACLEAARQKSCLLLERDALRAALVDRSSPALLGNSPALRRLREGIRRVAATPRTTVLIRGEPGSGREATAHAIHAASARRARPFSALSCAAASAADDADSLAIRLFGKGPAPGLLEHARGGSLYLHGIEALPRPLQSRLAQALETRTTTSEATDTSPGVEREHDVRILASCSQDLETLVSSGSFDEELDYRLNVLSVEVPPLRTRREDIQTLALHFLRRAWADRGQHPPGFAAGVIDHLRSREWPGNAKQLERHLTQAVERLALEGDPRPLALDDLQLGAPLPSRPASGSDALGEPALGPSAGTYSRVDAPPDQLPLGDRSLRQVEEALIRRVLQESEGNRSLAARTLGVNRTTLYNKLRQYDIEES